VDLNHAINNLQNILGQSSFNVNVNTPGVLECSVGKSNILINQELNGLMLNWNWQPTSGNNLVVVADIQIFNSTGKLAIQQGVGQGVATALPGNDPMNIYYNDDGNSGTNNLYDLIMSIGGDNPSFTPDPSGVDQAHGNVFIDLNNVARAITTAGAIEAVVTLYGAFTSSVGDGRVSGIIQGFVDQPSELRVENYLINPIGSTETIKSEVQIPMKCNSISNSFDGDYQAEYSPMMTVTIVPIFDIERSYLGCNLTIDNELTP
jgi:hypothetical protein